MRHQNPEGANPERPPRCDRNDCDDGYIIEPPGCQFGDVGVFDCPDCARIARNFWAARAQQEGKR